MTLTLRPFQAVGRAFLASQQKAILADRMGLGKTPQAITACDALAHELGRPLRILVIAPLATGLGWQREVARWSTSGLSLQVMRRKDPVPAGSAMVLIPWTDLSKRLPDILASPRFDVLIADEAHKAKSGKKAAMAEAFTGSWKKAGGEWQRTRGASDHADRAWMLTGTPMPNGRPIELLPLLTVAGVVGRGGRYNTPSDYHHRHCKQPNRWTPAGFDLLGCRDLDTLNANLVASGKFLRRDAADVAGELPDLQRSVVPLSGVKRSMPDADQQRIVSAALKRSNKLPAFEEMSEYRHTIGQAKVGPAVEWIIDHLGEGEEAAVVFVWHKDVGEAIAAALTTAGLGGPGGRRGVECATGDDAPDERQAKVDRFANKNGPRVLVASIAACGTGMNGMQLRTRCAIFVESPWDSASCDQAEGRIRRMGGDASDVIATAYYLCADDILDRHITTTIADKRDQIDESLGAGIGNEKSATAGVGAAAPASALSSAIDQYIDAIDAKQAATTGETAMPDPTNATWTWAKAQGGRWVVRANAQGVPAWTGSQVRVARRSGEVAVLALAGRIACGDHHGGWSLWNFEAIATPEAQGTRNVSYLAKRAASRGLEASGACDHTPLDAADQPAAEAARVAALRLTGLDPDRAGVRNAAGWSSADGMMGRILSETHPEYWTKGTLALARAMLVTYSRTQIADLWPAIAAKPTTTTPTTET